MCPDNVVPLFLKWGERVHMQRKEKETVTTIILVVVVFIFYSESIVEYNVG